MARKYTVMEEAPVTMDPIDDETPISTEPDPGGPLPGPVIPPERNGPDTSAPVVRAPVVSLQEWFQTRKVGQIEIAGAFVRLHTAGVGTEADLDAAFEAFKQQPA